MAGEGRRDAQVCGRDLVHYQVSRRWLGPALIALAIWNYLFPPLPEILGNPAALILQAGVLLTAIAAALLWRGSPAKKRHASILGIAAMLGSVVAAWQFWSAGQGFREEIVRFDSEGATLVGTLYLPESKGPHPGIVFVHGSGNMPRSANMPMGSSLARRGYVVLSYDKRGVGDSGGQYEWERNYCPDNLDLLARDAVAAMGVLRNRREVRADAVGLIGQSQGGWIVPRAAARDPDTAFMLLLVGPTDTTHAIIKHERYRLGVIEGDKEMKVASAFALLGPGGRIFATG
ncbi:MAG: alpha/beta fold hydrolase [Sphingomonadaceae bacterium]